VNRRTFIRQSSLATAGITLLPFWLSSCKKDVLKNQTEFSGKVLIVGAGVSGLYAASLLEQYGISYEILEASSHYGGRIRSLQGFTDFDIDLGADTIYGERSSWYDMVRHFGGELRGETNPLYYFNGSFKTSAQATENTFFNRTVEFSQSFKSYVGDDITVQEYANVSGIHSSMQHILNGMMGNAMGSSNTSIGTFGLRERAERWKAGQDMMRLKNKTFQALINECFQSVIDKVRYNTVVETIDYSGSSVLITDIEGNSYSADKVIVTVPLTVLKREDISFIPVLPESKTQAIQRIGMDRGIKVVMKFTERFWPDNTGEMYGSNAAPLYTATGAGGRGEDTILTAFVCGEQAEALALQGEGMVQTILQDLDSLWGSASEKYIAHHIQDWGSEPFIGGAYTYSKPGTGNARDVLAQTLSEKVYFAGEATHTQGHYATVHGAMETSLRAINEILFAE
jgi:monoamine oxidase